MAAELQDDAAFPFEKPVSGRSLYTSPLGFHLITKVHKKRQEIRRRLGQLRFRWAPCLLVILFSLFDDVFDGGYDKAIWKRKASEGHAAFPDGIILGFDLKIHGSFGHI